MRPVPPEARGSPLRAILREVVAVKSPGATPRSRPGSAQTAPGASIWRQRPFIDIAAVLIAANALAGVATFVFLQYLIPYPAGPRTGGHAARVITIAFVVYLCCAIPAGAATNARVFRPVARWLRAGRSPRPDEQWATLLQPVRQAGAAFAYWLLATVLFGVLTAVEGYPVHRVVVYVVGILIGAIASCSLSVLLIERVLRPVVVLALEGDTPRRAYGVGVRPRLLLAWAFGSGVPIVGLLLTAFDVHDSARAGRLNRPVLFLCIAALTVGFSLIFTAARSVADPLEAVRDALERVEAGDLSVELDVDDGGEVGQLEAGVNRMVAGLRQRRRLEDLFGRYVGEAVAQRALERGHDLGGERLQASMLFVDLVGSTQLAATVAPEEVVRTLNRYFRAVVETVGAEGGWVNKFEGDGAMCVFGAPADSQDHAERALRAARRLHAVLAETAAAGTGVAGTGVAGTGVAGTGATPDQSARRHRLDAAIGVSGGEVVAGNIGSPDRFEFTVIGDPVNEAARLTELAKTSAGRLLASAAAIDAAGGSEAALWRPAGSVTLRGRSQVTVIYEPR